MSDRYAILNENDEIINVVLWDGVTEWSPGEGLRAIPEAEATAKGLRPPAEPEQAEPEQAPTVDVDAVLAARTLAELRAAVADALTEITDRA